MSGTLAKHSNALGWAWYLDTDEGSYWVSHPVKEHIDSLEAENAKLRKLLKDTLPFIAEESGFCTADCFVYPVCCDYDGDEECPAVARIHERARELGVDV